MIVLRGYREEDLDTLVVLANNLNVSRYLVDTFPYPYTQKDGKWWLETGCKEGGANNFAIDYQGGFVGSIGVRPYSGWKKHISEIGYWIGEPYWGKGIGKEALKQMTCWAFGHTNCRKLVATVLHPNAISMRILEKCGYQCEGILKQEVCKSGEYYDLHVYAKMKK